MRDEDEADVPDPEIRTGSGSTGHPAADIYGPEFFREVESGSTESARVAVPVVLEWLPSERVLDVGAGEGAWAGQFLAHGCEVLAIDGPYVDRRRLQVPRQCFLAHDLTEPLPASVEEWAADLTVCLEVAEHLPAARGPSLVAELCRTSDRVLFSAAVPGQGGYGHINERPPAYWAELFEDQGFAISRVLQRRLAPLEEVAWWYRQNITVAVRVSTRPPWTGVAR
jgi:hypothetical protein